MPERKYFLPVLLTVMALSAGACSVPNLESSQCIAARESVKKFYSFHFGSRGSGSDESVAVMRSYLTDRLNSERSKEPDGEIDYFTRTSNFPTAFRIGSCESVSETEARFQVVLLWRSDSSSEQTEVKASAVKDGDKWFIDRVTE